MNILSIDTASNICGVSVLNDNNLVCQLDKDTGTTHSENLMPMISLSLEKTNLSLKDIDLLVCDIGPGSFTGIRIGISTIKAFMDSLNIKCSGVSSLESLAYNVKLEFGQSYNGLVCSILDCKNSNCYFALYKFENGICNCLLDPLSDNINNCMDLLKDYIDSNIVFVGDGTIVFRDIITSLFPNCIFIEDDKNSLNSYSLALAGIHKAYFSDSSKILPLYLKKPQAQIQMENKLRKD